MGPSFVWHPKGRNHKKMEQMSLVCILYPTPLTWSTVMYLGLKGVTHTMKREVNDHKNTRETTDSLRATLCEIRPNPMELS